MNPSRQDVARSLSPSAKAFNFNTLHAATSEAAGTAYALLSMSGVSAHSLSIYSQEETNGNITDDDPFGQFGSFGMAGSIGDNEVSLCSLYC